MDPNQTTERGKYVKDMCLRCRKWRNTVRQATDYLCATCVRETANETE